MAPTSDEVIDTLKSTVDKLEQRVVELESRLAGKASGGSNASGMRMIIMGPPGAGTTSRLAQWKRIRIQLL
jgi:adenylate kinase